MLNFGGVTFRHFSHGQRTSPQFAGGKPHLGGHSSPLAASRSDGFFCAEKIGAPRKIPGIFQLTLMRSIWFFWCQCLIRSFRWILGIKQSRSLITSVIMSTCLFWKMEFVVECLSWQNFCTVSVWLLNHDPFNFLTVVLWTTTCSWCLPRTYFWQHILPGTLFELRGGGKPNLQHLAISEPKYVKWNLHLPGNSGDLCGIVKWPPSTIGDKKVTAWITW